MVRKLKKWTINRKADILRCIDESSKELIPVLESRAEMSSGLISRWRKNSTDPRLSYILKLVKALDLELVIQEHDKTDLSFLDAKIANSNLGVLERKINKRAGSLHSEEAEIIAKILLIYDISLEDKMAIREILNILIEIDGLG